MDTRQQGSKLMEPITIRDALTLGDRHGWSADWAEPGQLLNRQHPPKRDPSGVAHYHLGDVYSSSSLVLTSGDHVCLALQTEMGYQSSELGEAGPEGTLALSQPVTEAVLINADGVFMTGHRTEAIVFLFGQAELAE